LNARKLEFVKVGGTAVLDHRSRADGLLVRDLRDRAGRRRLGVVVRGR
jgi:hypothetical protein